MLADFLDRLAGAALDHPFHDRSDLVGGQRIEHLLTFIDQFRLVLVGPFRRVAGRADPLVMAVDGVAIAVLHAVDQRRLDAPPAIGQHGIGRGHFQQCGLASPQRHRQHGLHILVNAKTLGIFGNQRHADIFGQPDRHLVDRMFDTKTQGMGAARLAFEIFRPPDSKAPALVDFDWRIEHDRAWRVAIVQRRRIDDGLKRRTWLALRLGSAVEFRLVEREAADHGEDPASIGIHRDNAAGDLRNLA